MGAAELRRIPYVQGSLDLVIKNHGPSVARDVEVTFDPPIPAPPDDGEGHVSPFIVERYASPILTLTPGQELTNIYWSGRVLSEGWVNHEPTPDAITVTISYRGRGRKRYVDPYPLHVDLLRKTTYSTSSTAPESRLKEIAQSVGKMQRSIAGLVDVLAAKR